MIRTNLWRMISLLLLILTIIGCSPAQQAATSSSAAAASELAVAVPTDTPPPAPGASASASPVAADATPTLDLPTAAPTITAAPQASAFALQAGWWDNAVCYEVFVRSFYDSDNDGVGDINGLIQKLDYINDGDPNRQTDLGANCIWLMPIAESPSYHGYDVVDYYKVDREYGTNDDFKRLVQEAHKRGIKVILDLVLNHTSSANPWFKAALNDPQSPYRDWYIWSKDNPGYKSPWGSVAWHKSPVRDEYYYGIFSQGMPDLNYRNPAVTAEARKISAFWLNDMGADGFRLDAIKHLIENGKTQEGTPETLAWLREYRTFLQQTKPGAFTIGEVLGANNITLKKYYPDTLDTYFAFEIADKTIAAADSGNATAFALTVNNAYNTLPYQRYAPLLTNHDQNRVMGVLRNDLGKMKIAATALLTQPGMPFLYYGEEIGMLGAKPDEQIRAPMQWSGDNNGGFTSGRPWEPFQPNYQEVNVAAQDADPTSLLNLYRRLIKLHTSNAALAQGNFVLLKTNNASVAAFVRQSADQTVLVALNFGKVAAQSVALQADPAQFPNGGYTLQPLLNGTSQSLSILALDANPDVADFEPLQTLEPQTGYVFTLSK